MEVDGCKLENEEIINKSHHKYEEIINKSLSSHGFDQEKYGERRNIGKKRSIEIGEDNMATKETKKDIGSKSVGFGCKQQDTKTNKQVFPNKQDDIMNARLKIKYDKLDVGPLKAIIQKIYRGESNKRHKFSNIAMGRLIKKAGIKFATLERNGTHK